MDNTKPWYLSLGAVSALVAFVLMVAGRFGFETSPDDHAALVKLIVDGGAIVAAVLAFIGRFRAKTKLTLK